MLRKQMKNNSLFSQTVSQADVMHIHLTKSVNSGIGEHSCIME